MINKPPLEVLRRLVESLPRCCSCEKDYVVVYNAERWGLCERCFEKVPCGDFPPVHDMRGPVYVALALLASTEKDVITEDVVSTRFDTRRDEDDGE